MLVSVRLLLVVLTACSALAGAAQPTPNTWILLPVLAINNATLTAGYDCHPIDTAAPCAGHGDCYLLLDSADPASRLYMQSATQRPLPVNSSNLDHSDLDPSTPLPAAVCLCQTGYTGRGDYVDHDAMDGDSCAVHQPTIDSLAASGCVLFSFLLLLALVRLRGWYVWHSSTVAAAAALTAQPHTPKQHSLRVDVVVSTSSSQPPISRAAVLLSPVSKVAQPTEAVRPLSRGSDGRSTVAVHPSNEQQVEWQRRKRTRLIRHLRHDSFLHPACAVVLSVCSLVYFVLRLTTRLTVGDSYVLSVLIYVQHLPYMAASCLGVAGTLQLAASIARMKLANGVDAVAVTKKCLIGLCLYQCVAWTVVLLLVQSLEHQEQLHAQLFLLLCLCPDFLVGPITLLAVRHINRALLTNLDSLSAEQQQQRRAVQQKMVRMAVVVGVLTLANSITCVWLAADHRARQSGLPYYALVWHYSVFVLIGIRLALVQPPRPIAAVCPLPRRGAAAGGGGIVSHNSSGGTTSASSRPVGHVRNKSVGMSGMRTSAGSSQVPHGPIRLPKLIGATASMTMGGCESVVETATGEQTPTQQSVIAETTASNG